MSDYSDLEVSPDVVIEAPRADPEHFKSAMRAFATGVVIVTVEVDGKLSGLTINSCCSISTRPPQVLISLAHTASCREPLLRRGRFGLSILAEQHRELAELGAVPGGPKVVDVFADRLGDDGPGDDRRSARASRLLGGGDVRGERPHTRDRACRAGARRRVRRGAGEPARLLRPHLQTAWRPL